MPAARQRIHLSPPHLGGEEYEFLKQALDGNFIAPLGPEVDAFEREFSVYTRIKGALAVSSGTAAMHLALHHLGVGPGDEVFASDLTFIGSVGPVCWLGGIPVFIDSHPDTWNMDPDLLQEELKRCAESGRLPKAVVPTELYGQCLDYGRIRDICSRFGVPVVVDSAESAGSLHYPSQQDKASDRCGTPAGKGARAAVYSFNGNKIVTTSGGGMLASDDDELIDHARKLAQQAREPLPQYEHREIGYNYRLSNLLAALGRAQLRMLPQRVRRKREIFEFYRDALQDAPGVSFMPEAAFCRSNRWLTVILIDPDRFGADRESVRQALEAENIESRPVWKPMHLQPVFAGEAGDCGRGPARYTSRTVGGTVGERLYAQGLCLPSGTSMTEEDLLRVVRTLREAGQR
jgi:dTDP-4-amino-4,6-dideoxygalactose transaminase